MNSVKQYSLCKQAETEAVKAGRVLEERNITTDISSTVEREDFVKHLMSPQSHVQL